MPKQKPKTKPLRSFIVQSMPITHQATYRLMQKRMIQGLVALRILDNVLPRYTDIKTIESLTCLARANLDEACDLLFERRERYKILMEKSGLNIEMLKSSRTYEWRMDISSPSARLLIKTMGDLDSTLSYLDLCWITDMVNNSSHITDEISAVQIVDDSIKRLADFVNESLNASSPGHQHKKIKAATVQAKEDGSLVVNGSDIEALAEERADTSGSNTETPADDPPADTTASDNVETGDKAASEPQPDSKSKTKHRGVMAALVRK